jgi:XRE family aerobic/anaerobic benzoate catabolism transcriptional regulator
MQGLASGLEPRHFAIMAERPSPAPRDEADASSSDPAYLARLGERVREIRARRGMTRKILARDSGVSERYLAQLEAGQGNISILLLRQLSTALDVPLESLVLQGQEPPIELVHATELLRRLTPGELEQAHQLLLETFGGVGVKGRKGRIALIGLRGAGKSTLGGMLAERLGCPFIELDKEIEAEAGAPLNAIFDLYGQPAFRRLERRCLERVVEQNPRAVIATGGGLVSDPATFERLLASCFTVWIKATPTEHMERVIAQGDMRPMSDNREAMSDLQRILRGRESLYGKADAQIDTTRSTVAESLDKLVAAIA